MDTTKWTPIPGFDGAYEIRLIDRDVQIRSYRKRGTGGLSKSPIILPGNFDSRDGRRRYGLTNPSGRQLVKQAAYWVLLTLVGNPSFEDAQALHRNDDNLDNRLHNLYWGTDSDNKRDRNINGRDNPSVGEKHPLSVLTEDQVICIRQSSSPTSILAEKLEASPKAVADARTGRSWGCLNKTQPPQRNVGSNKRPIWQSI